MQDEIDNVNFIGTHIFIQQGLLLQRILRIMRVAVIIECLYHIIYVLSSKHIWSIKYIMDRLHY